jgi:hypothetical protein
MPLSGDLVCASGSNFVRTKSWFGWAGLGRVSFENESKPEKWRTPLQTIRSVIRNQFAILPGFLTATLAAAILAAPLLLAQEAKPDQPQSAPEATSDQTQSEPTVVQRAPEATPDQAQSEPAAQQTESEQPKSGSENARVFSVNWDNTVKYSGAFRLTSPSATLIDPANNVSNTNQDDGDRAFSTGMISDRGDVLSEIDVTYGNVGLRASGAFWGDAAYLGTSADNSPSTFNALSVNYNQWTEGARDLTLGHMELLDAFAFGKFNIGSSTLSVRGGQYALQWGESLFFGTNGIAGGMAPVDLIKLLGVPSSQFKEIIRPVPQVSMQYQVTPAFAIGAFYQLGWQATRFPPVGSYYSFVDILGQGAERLIVGAPIQIGPTTFTGPLAFFHSKDREPKSWGQFGAQVKFRLPNGWDAGIYGIQYHEKAGQLYLQPFGEAQTQSQFMAGQIGNFYWAYPENVKAIAVSATKSHGVFNYAAEFGAHFNQDLVSDGQTDASIASFGHVPAPDANSNPLYAVGKTIHGQASWIASLGPSFVSKEASWAGEIAWNMLETIDKNPASLDPNTTKHAVGIRTTYEPTYRQVLPGTDISWTVGGAYFPMSRSSVINGFGPNKGGDYSAGFEVAYLDAWRIGATYTGYYGKAAGFLDANNHYNMMQDFADRYNISFNIRHTIGLKFKSHAK